MLHIELAQEAFYALTERTPVLHRYAAIQATEDAAIELYELLQDFSVLDRREAIKEFVNLITQHYDFAMSGLSNSFKLLVIEWLREEGPQSYEEAIGDDLLGFEEIDDLLF